MSMIGIRHVGLLVPLVTIACGGYAPPRPVSVPQEAVWAGGADGGVWIGCRHTMKEPYSGYSCTTYNEHTGEVWATGNFMLVSRESGSYMPLGPFAADHLADFSWYDGSVICISDNVFLVPHGWIDHPSDGGHGKRERYAMGQLKEETEY